MTYQEEVDERELHMQGWREGSPLAFKNLFICLYPTFLSFASSLLQEREVAQQVTTEAFFMLWKKRNDLDELKNIRFFLYNAIRNHALNYCRHRQKAPAEKRYTAQFWADGSLPEEMVCEMMAYVASGI